MLNEYINKTIANLPKGVKISSITVNTEGYEMLNKIKVNDLLQKSEQDSGFISIYISSVPITIDKEQESLFVIKYEVNK